MLAGGAQESKTCSSPDSAVRFVGAPGTPNSAVYVIINLGASEGDQHHKIYASLSLIVSSSSNTELIANQQSKRYIINGIPSHQEYQTNPPLSIIS